HVRACPLSASERAIASFCSFVQPVFAPTLTSRATSPRFNTGRNLVSSTIRCAAVVASVAEITPDDGGGAIVSFLSAAFKAAARTGTFLVLRLRMPARGAAWRTGLYVKKSRTGLSLLVSVTKFSG